MSQLHLASLPESVYAEQARQINALLQANGYKMRLSAQEIATAVPKSGPAKALPSMQEQMQEAFSGQAGVFRRVVDGTATEAEKEQVGMQVALVSQTRPMALRPAQSMKQNVFAGVTPSQIQAFTEYSTVLGCEGESLGELSRIYRLFGADAAARSANEEAWKLTAEAPDLGRREQMESARKLGLSVPGASSWCFASPFPAPCRISGRAI